MRLRSVHLQRGGCARGDELGAELLRLLPCPLGELAARHPVRKAQVILDPRALARLAAGRSAFDQHRPQPLRCAVHRGGQPRRAAADDDQVVELLRRCGGQAQLAGKLGVGGLDQRLAAFRHDDRQPHAVLARGLQQLLAGGLVGHEPGVEKAVAGEEVADLPGPRRPAVPDHLGVGDGAFRRPLPRRQQRIDNGVELLLGRVPWLQQVVVEVDDVDRVDGGVGVGVGGQQHAPRHRIQIHRPLEEFDAAHLRHPVVRDQHRDRLATQFEFLKRLQRVGTGFRADDAVLLAVMAAQVAGDRARHRGIVVHGQQHWFSGRAGRDIGTCHPPQYPPVPGTATGAESEAVKLAAVKDTLDRGPWRQARRGGQRAAIPRLTPKCRRFAGDRGRFAALPEPGLSSTGSAQICCLASEMAEFEAWARCVRERLRHERTGPRRRRDMSQVTSPRGGCLASRQLQRW